MVSDGNIVSVCAYVLNKQFFFLSGAFENNENKE